MYEGLTVKGNKELLNGFKIGILASRVILPNLTELVLRALRRICDGKDIVLTGGWHSPMEAEIHSELVNSATPHIHVDAKSVQGASCQMQSDGILFVTHCEPGVNRITRANALKRNEVVCEIADVILIPWLDPSGKTHNIVRGSCGKKPVYVFDSEYNRQLVEAGAKTLTEAGVSTLIEKYYAYR